MSVAEILEAVHATQVDHGHDVERVHGRIAPALVEEPPTLLQVLEELDVLGVAKERERRELEVVEELHALEAAVVVERGALVGRVHQGDELGDARVAQLAPGAGHPFLDGAPQCRYAGQVLVVGDDEAVGLVVAHQLGKRVLANRTRKVDVWVEAQVVVVLERELVAEEEAAVVATHQVVRDEVAFGHARQRLVEAQLEASLGDDARQPPVLGRYDAELDLGASAVAHRRLELDSEGIRVDDHVRVVVEVVESFLHLADGVEERAQVALLCQYEDAGLDVGHGRLEGEGARASARSARVQQELPRDEEQANQIGVDHHLETSLHFGALFALSSLL